MFLAPVLEMIELDELVFIEQGSRRRKSTFKILVPKENCVNRIKEKKWNEYSMKMLRRYQNKKLLQW